MANNSNDPVMQNQDVIQGARWRRRTPPPGNDHQLHCVLRFDSAPRQTPQF